MLGNTKKSLLYTEYLQIPLALNLKLNYEESTTYSCPISCK
jgi:hypothetical protein